MLIIDSIVVLPCTSTWKHIRNIYLYKHNIHIIDNIKLRWLTTNVYNVEMLTMLEVQRDTFS